MLDPLLEACARDCVRLAQLSGNPELTRQLLAIARDYMAAAMDEPAAAPGGLPQSAATDLRPA
jgi:hypothetical protein